MSSIGSVKKLTLLVAASATLGAVALVLATVASANLPKKPACSDVSYSMIGAAFGTTPSYTDDSGWLKDPVLRVPTLMCGYCTAKCDPATSGSGVVAAVQFWRGTTGDAHRVYTYFAHEARNPKTVGLGCSQVQTVSGIGDQAFYCVPTLIFRDGIDVVSIKHGVGKEQANDPAVRQAFETLAKQVLKVA